MEIRQIEAFLKSAELGSFSKTADELCLTQPAITRQIAALEAELNTRLFDRLGRRVALTASGIALLTYAKEIVRLIDESRNAVADVGAGTGGRLAIGASSTAATYLLPDLLQSYSLKHPMVQLSVLTGPSARIAEMVVQNAVDIGIVMDNRPLAGLRRVDLSAYRIVVVAHPGHKFALLGGKVSVAVLADTSLITMQIGTTLRNYAENMLATNHGDFKVSMELDSVEAIKKMTLAGLGVALLPDIAVKTEVSDGSLVTLQIESTEDSTLSVAAIYREDKYVTAAMKSMVNLLQDSL